MQCKNPTKKKNPKLSHPKFFVIVIEYTLYI